MSAMSRNRYSPDRDVEHPLELGQGGKVPARRGLADVRTPGGQVDGPRAVVGVGPVEYLAQAPKAGGHRGAAQAFAAAGTIFGPNPAQGVLQNGRRQPMAVLFGVFFPEGHKRRQVSQVQLGCILLDGASAQFVVQVELDDGGEEARVDALIAAGKTDGVQHGGMPF
ncbi:MAG: hypothetical protein KatS3mg051_1033 [Anaerolineae bacterium]|nr:MAG: hypothetical protein KatS3mg051_1033 [Anaerolineae bacterium]